MQGTRTDLAVPCRLVWPLYWAAQGTMFWALFVVGHDWCVHHYSSWHRGRIM